MGTKTGLEILTACGKPRVLLVDDDPVSAKQMSHLLVQLEIPFDTAKDVREALRKHRENSYLIFISDWVMPDDLGTELCKEVRLRQPDEYVYFILCSSFSFKADFSEAFAAGIDDFMQKPINPTELIGRLYVACRILSHQDRVREQTRSLAWSQDLLEATNTTLLMASSRFAELFHGLPVACFTYDTNGLIHEWNRASEEQFGILGYKAFQKPIWSLFGGESGPWGPEEVQRLFEGDNTQRFDWLLEGDKRKEFACNFFVLKDRAGNRLGAICANLDITNRRLAQQRMVDIAEELETQRLVLLETNAHLEHLATTDSLTGLVNRRYFTQRLEDRLREQTAKGQELSIVLLDIDHFKSLNDEYGHHAGDETLQCFARQLTHCRLGSDLICRYGGEEFVVLLGASGSEAAMAVAERFRTSIEQANWPHRPITASLGVATVSKPETSLNSLMKQADEALYYSKQNGRNRVTHFRSLIEQTTAA